MQAALSRARPLLLWPPHKPNFRRKLPPVPGHSDALTMLWREMWRVTERVAARPG